MHRFANSAKFPQRAKQLTPVLFWSGLLLLSIACGWGLFANPSKRPTGDIAKIILIYGPAAWLGIVGWMAIAAASIMQLFWRHPLAGIGARASAIPGATFAAICLITGSIWVRPISGIWWIWDGNLTTLLVLFFLYLGYIGLANASSEKGNMSRVAAVFGIIGAVNIPIIYLSVSWWESQHKKASIALGESSVDGAYLWPLLFSVVGFSLIFCAVVLMRMRAALAETRIETRMRRLAED